MLPRSVLLIVVVSCWLDISATVPFNLKNDYQDYHGNEDVMDYAFPDVEGAVEKPSMLETLKKTMTTVKQMEALHDKENINVNSYSSRYKRGKNTISFGYNVETSSSESDEGEEQKQSKENNIMKYMGNEVDNGKINKNNATRKSSQKLVREILRDSGKMQSRKRKLSGEKIPSHCFNTRRSNNNNYLYNSNMNSSYFNIDEDFTTNTDAKIKMTHTVFTNEYITLCWIETTTIKIDNSHNPPKRLVIRESTVTIENAATIPDEYLACSNVDNDIALESEETLCDSSFVEGIDEDTKLSRTVNITKFTHEKNIDVQTNKIIKCTMGPVVTKDIFRWANDSEPAKQRVEVKISPRISSVEEICNNHHADDIDASLNNGSVECSNESELSEPEEESTEKENKTICLGKNCSNDNTVKPTVANILSKLNNISLTIVPLKNVLSSTLPSIVSEINEVLSTGFTNKPLATEFPTKDNPRIHHPSKEVPCNGLNCSSNIPENISNVSIMTDQLPKQDVINLPMDLDESCNGSECDNFGSITKNQTVQVSDVDDDSKNKISSSEKLDQKEKDKLHIPKPFICSMKDKKTCAYLQHLIKSQPLGQSTEESLDQSDNASRSSNETVFKEKVLDKKYNDSIVDDISTSDISPLRGLNKKNFSPHSKPTIASESEQNYSSEMTSDQSILPNRAKVKYQDISGDSSGMENVAVSSYNPGIIEGSSEIEDSEIASTEVDNKTSLNDFILNESCDESGNCHPSNFTYTQRFILPSGRPLPHLATLNQTNERKVEEDNEVDSGSCDCDKESDESKKCDSKSGSCSTESSHQSDENIAMLLLQEYNENQMRGMKNNSTSNQQKIKKILRTIDSKNEKIDKSQSNNLSNHKLLLRIHVSLEHIDENKKNHTLAEVAKNITLNESPDEHDHHSLYLQIKALNESADDIEAIKNIFNCSILEQLAEEAILDKLNMTNSEYEKLYNDENNLTLNHARHRRNSENLITSVNNTKNNESVIGGSIMKQCILPNIREDIRNGLIDVVFHLLKVLNNSMNITNGNLENSSRIENNFNSTEPSNATTPMSRSKRSALSINNNDGELSRWSNERFTPSNGGGQLRSFTELKIIKNSDGL